MIKKTLIIFIFIILFSSVLAEINISQNVTQNAISNPITNFMQKQTSSEFFKFIGAPTQLTNQDLILYLTLSIIFFFALSSILIDFSTFQKSTSYVISLGISVIMLSLGVINQIYISIINSTISKYTVLIIIILYFFARITVKILRKTKGQKSLNDDLIKAEERGGKIKATIKGMEIISDGIKG